jgi:hypothetical protein
MTGIRHVGKPTTGTPRRFSVTPFVMSQTRHAAQTRPNAENLGSRNMYAIGRP